jgi:hypothetical protein
MQLAGQDFMAGLGYTPLDVPSNIVCVLASNANSFATTRYSVIRGMAGQ